MSSIKEIRGTIDTKLDKWEAQATALEAQLEIGKEQAAQRVETQKRQFEEVAQKVQSKVDAASGLAAETKTKIQASFEHLQVQLALGIADTRDAYDDWKHKIQTGIAAFEADLERAIAEDDAALQAELDALEEDYVKAADAFDAEIEALQAQYSEDKAQAKAEFEKVKTDLQSQIVAYKSELNDKRQVASDKLDTFENELAAGATKIKSAFSNLFS